MSGFDAWIAANLTEVRAGTGYDFDFATLPSGYAEIGSGSLTFEVQGDILGDAADEALRFDGTNYVQDSSAPINLWGGIANPQGTVIAVFKTAVTSGTMCLWTCTRSDSRRQFQFYLQPQGSASDVIGVTIRSVTSSGNVFNQIGSGVRYSDDEFHFIAMVQAADGTGVQIYVDGTALTMGTPFTAGTATADYWWPDCLPGSGSAERFGAFIPPGNSQIFDGDLSLLGAYEEAMTAQDVADLQATREPGLVKNTRRRRRVFAV